MDQGKSHSHSDHPTLKPSPIIQRSRSVALLFSEPYQTKVTLGKTGDYYEREADTVADTVTTGGKAPNISRIPPGGLRSQKMEDQSKTPPVPKKTTGTASSDDAVQQNSTTPVEDAIRTKGKDEHSQPVAEKNRRSGSGSGDVQTKCVEYVDTDSQKVQVKAEDSESGVVRTREDTKETVQRQPGGDHTPIGTIHEADQKENKTSRAKADQNQPESKTGNESSTQEKTTESPSKAGKVKQIQEQSEVSSSEASEAESQTKPQTEEKNEGGDTVQENSGEREPESGTTEPAQALLEEENNSARVDEDTETGGPARESAATEQTSDGEERDSEAPETTSEETHDDNEPDDREPDSSDAENEEEGRDAEDDLGCGEEPAGEAGEGDRNGGCGTPSASAAEEPSGPEAGAGNESEESAAESAGEEAAGETEGESGGGGCDTNAQPNPETTADEYAQMKTADDSGSSKRPSGISAPPPGIPNPMRRREQIVGEAIRTRGPGEPLDPHVRDRLENAMGYDFGRVRVHSGADASETNRGLKAKAFTHKEHIWLGAGRSQSDLRLMAHEMTHVVQQGAVERRPGAHPSEDSKQSEPLTDQEATAKTVKPGSDSGAATGSATKPENLPESRRMESETPETKPIDETGRRVSERPAKASPEPMPDTSAALEGAADITSGMPMTRFVPAVGGDKGETPIKPTREADAGEVASGPSKSGVRSPAADDALPSMPVPETPEMPAVSSRTDDPSSILQRFIQISPLKAPFKINRLSSEMHQAAARRRTAEAVTPAEAHYEPFPPGQGKVFNQTVIKDKKQIQPLCHFPDGPEAPKADRIPSHQHKGDPPSVLKGEDPSAVLNGIPDTDDTGLRTAARGYVKRLLARIPVTDPDVNTNPGKMPHIFLTGQADPKRIPVMSGRGKKQLQDQKTARDKEISQDFGEAGIVPDAKPEKMTKKVPSRLRAKEERCPASKQIEPYRFDPEDEIDLSNRMRKKQKNDINAQILKLVRAESMRDAEIGNARSEGPRKIKKLHADAYLAQFTRIEEGKTRVSGYRKEWQKKNDEIITGFEGEAGKKGRQVDGEIKRTVKNERSEISKEYQGVKDRSKKAEKKASDEAKHIRRTERKKSRSWLNVLDGLGLKKQAIKLAMRISRKLTSIFGKLRKKFRALFDRFKKWALSKIELFRRWAIGTLENFRKWLHKAVDKYLGQFPRIAKLFKQKIDDAVKRTKRTINRWARTLKKCVSQMMDWITTKVDSALRKLESTLQTIVWAMCNLAVSGINYMKFLVNRDIDSLITLIRDLPEPAFLGVLWPAVKYALIGFLERFRSKPEDEKKRYARKTLRMSYSLSAFGGYLLGVIKGFAWDGLVGLIIMLYDIVTGIPKAIKGIYNYFKHLFSDREAVDKLIAHAAGVWTTLKAFIKKPEAAAQMMRLIRKSPSILLNIVKLAHGKVKGWAFDAGVKAADKLFSLVLNNSLFDLGFKIGTIAGQVIFEVVLAIFSYGSGTAIKWGAKAIQMLAKAGKWLTRAAKGGSVISRILKRVRSVVRAGFEMAKRLGKGLRQIFDKLNGLLDSIFDWFKRGFLRSKKRSGPKPKPHRRRGRRDRDKDRDRAYSWQRLKIAVKSRVKQFTSGATRSQLKSTLQGIKTRGKYRKAGITFKKSTRESVWIIKARRPRSKILDTLTTVLEDRPTRWKEGKKAVQVKVKTLRANQKNIPGLKRVLKPIEKRYHYTSLEPVEDKQELDFNIMGAMSNKKEIAEVENIEAVWQSYLRKMRQKGKRLNDAGGATAGRLLSATKRISVSHRAAWKHESHDPHRSVSKRIITAIKDGTNDITTVIRVWKSKTERLAEARAYVKQRRRKLTESQINTGYMGRIARWIVVKFGFQKPLNIQEHGKTDPYLSPTRKPMWRFRGRLLHGSERNIGEIDDTRKLHKGKSATDAIPIKWYKHPDSYPNSVTLMGSSGQRLTVTRYSQATLSHGGESIRIGFREKMLVRTGMTLTKAPPGRAARVRGSGKEQRKYRELMSKYGYKMSDRKEDADHVTDLAFDEGKNTYDNLWPLNSLKNQKGRFWYGNTRVLVKLDPGTAHIRNLHKIPGRKIRITGYEESISKKRIYGVDP